MYVHANLKWWCGAWIFAMTVLSHLGAIRRRQVGEYARPKNLNTMTSLCCSHLGYPKFLLAQVHMTRSPEWPLFDHDDNKKKSEGMFLGQLLILGVAVNRKHGDVTDALQRTRIACEVIQKTIVLHHLIQINKQLVYNNMKLNKQLINSRVGGASTQF